LPLKPVSKEGLEQKFDRMAVDTEFLKNKMTFLRNFFLILPLLLVSELSGRDLLIDGFETDTEVNSLGSYRLTDSGAGVILSAKRITDTSSVHDGVGAMRIKYVVPRGKSALWGEDISELNLSPKGTISFWIRAGRDTKNAVVVEVQDSEGHIFRRKISFPNKRWRRATLSASSLSKAGLNLSSLYSLSFRFKGSGDVVLDTVRASGVIPKAQEKEPKQARKKDKKKFSEPFRDFHYTISDDHDTVKTLLKKARAKGPSDEKLLEEVSKAAFQYFWNEINPKTGFIFDASYNHSSSNASTGFGLAVICVADYRKWITHEQAYERVLKTLKSLISNPGWETIAGMFYHWVDAETGRWTGAEGMCLHDHVALYAGVMTVRQYFKGTEIEKLADQIVDMPNYSFLMHKGKGTGSEGAGLLSNVSSPQNEDWGPVTEYDGLKLDYLFPIGASRNAVNPKYWDNWARTYQWGDYKGRYHRITRAAIWIHQWDNLFLDLFCMRDAYADYFQNSVENILANRQWSIDNKMYSAELWGMNPTSGPDASGKGSIYGDYGAPPAPDGSWQQGHTQDGTIAFTAAVPSIVFTPMESMLVLRYMWNNLKPKMWGKYGFTTSFNLKRNWYSKHYIGIDHGPIVIMIENYRSGLIWKNFMKNPEVQRALYLAGFVGIVDNFDPMEHSAPYAKWSVPKKGYALSVVTHPRLELEHSIFVEYNSPSPSDTFVAEPMRKDFSYYSYLGVYINSRHERNFIDVTIEDSDGNRKKLRASSNKAVLRIGPWRLYAWEITKDSKLDLESVEKVVFKVRDPGSSGSFTMDYVFLYNGYDDAPDRPRRVLTLK